MLVVDIERFGSPTRTDRDRVALRADLYEVLGAAFTELTECDLQNTGDGVVLRGSRAARRRWTSPHATDLPPTWRAWRGS
jgi:hypothetical protein